MTHSDANNFPGGLEDLSSELTAKEQALVACVLRRPGMTHEEIGGAMGMSRASVTRMMRRSHVKDVIAEALARITSVVEVEARKLYLRALDRLGEMYEIGSSATNREALAGFRELRELLTGVGQPSSIDPGSPHRPRGVIIVPYEHTCTSCGHVDGGDEDDADA